MTSQWTADQERGLLLLIGVALLVSGLTVYRPNRQPGDLSPDLENQPIVLENVTVVVPVFVEPRLVNVNTAGIEELVELDGIGPALAGRIVAHRKVQGLFSSVEDLLHVNGIGPQTLEGLRDQATVDGGDSLP